MILIVKVKDTDNVIGLKEDIVYRIEQVTDVEHVEVQREGFWQRRNNGKRCSVCGWSYWSNGAGTAYCPGCGARMKGGEQK